MKILILSNDYKTLANFRTELLERLVGDKHEVIISVPADDRNEQFRSLGCTVYENSMTRHGTNPLAELKTVGEYKRLINEIRPDVVLTYTIKPNIYGGMACKKCRVPVMSNVTGIGSTMQNKGLKQTIMFCLMKYGMKNSDVIFFQNKGNMELFFERGICKKEAVLLCGSGVNLEKHAFVPYPKEDGKIKFIVVSRLRKDKGFDELFTAIKQLGKRQDVEYHVVGWCEEQEYGRQMEEMVKEYPIIYHGEKTQKEVHELISQCHCIVHPSHHEGMANVLMEASAAGRACIASDIPGCQEIIEDGKTGFVFPVKNASSLVEAMEKFLGSSKEERESMGKKAREKMENEFDRQFVINKYVEYINKITKR